MSYAGLQMFMSKLKQLIYCTENPLINNPSIVCERAQFVLLYEELDSMIQMLFIHKDHDLEMFEKVRIQWKRYKAAAEEAEDIVDLFLSTVHFRNNGYFPRSDVFHPSLHLEVVMRSMESIKMEFMTMFTDNMKTDSCPISDRLQMQSAAAAGTSSTRNSLGSKKVFEEIIVGLDRDVELIRDELVKDRKQLDVVCIVGMGGIGKTTLASIVFNDPFVNSYFYVRAWVTVSQTYENRDLLIQILSSMYGQLELENEKESLLREMLHKSLKGKRYLIVIDDIWSIKAWDKLKLIFPDDNTGSRILFTSRLTEVASHVKSDGFIHQLQYLTDEESWELLCRKVFQNDECPDWLIEPGIQIAKDCHGLPLSVVVLAGVLAKEAKSKNSWEKVALGVRSYIAGDERGCLKTLALSYHHLPLHLRECFLYLGGFHEDSWILVKRLTWVWIAEGFIQEDGSQSLEETAEGYLMDLVDRNLVIVTERKFNGEVRVCKVHGLVRELCVEKAKEERFFLRIEGPLPFDLQQGCLKTILSYHRLPLPLRKCFCSLGRYLENSWKPVWWLISLWIAEGFIREDGSQSLEEIAEGYLIDLVDRNLVIVTERMYLVGGNRLYGDDRLYKVNDLVWNLCVRKAREESLRFSRKDKRSSYVSAGGIIRAEEITTYKPRRVFTYREIYIASSTHPPTPSMRSLSCFHSRLKWIYNIAEYFRSFALLRVLNLPNCISIDFPPGIALLVHLRYLEIEHSLFPTLICNLWSLQTLIVRTSYISLVVPSNISTLVNLKHLWSNTELYLPSIRTPMKLQTISNVVLGDGVENFQKCFPNIKKLACTLYSDSENDFELLHNLETLKLTGLGSRRRESIKPEFLRNCGKNSIRFPATLKKTDSENDFELLHNLETLKLTGLGSRRRESIKPEFLRNCGKNSIRFPATLKKLTLVRCRLSWSDMSIIQSLPKLESLRLIDNAFEGTLWETGEDQFQQLQFLRLEELNMRQWEASSTNFPCLKRLWVVKCKYLEEIPLEMGDISTLEVLEADGCGASLNTSLEKIQIMQEIVN